MKTIQDLSHATFYQMHKYNQLVIDFVQEFEDIESDEQNENVKDRYSAMHYEIDNILTIIDKSLTDDIEILESLKKLIVEKTTKFS